MINLLIFVIIIVIILWAIYNIIPIPMQIRNLIALLIIIIALIFILYHTPGLRLN